MTTVDVLLPSVRTRAESRKAGHKERKQLPLWQETLLLLVIALGLAILIKAFFVQALLHPVALDGAAVRQERPDPRAEGLLLGRRRPPARRHHRLQGPGRLAARPGHPGPQVGRQEGDGDDRSLSRGRSPREAGDRRRRRPRRLLRHPGSRDRQRPARWTSSRTCPRTPRPRSPGSTRRSPRAICG